MEALVNAANDERKRFQSMLTPEQINSFHENGYLIVRDCIPPAVIEELRGAADALQRDALARMREPNYSDGLKRVNKSWIEHERDHFVYREKPDGSLSFHRVERMFTRQAVFRRFAMTPELLSAAHQLIGLPFWPRAGALVVKLPREGAEVRWHQDIPYLYWSSGGHPGKGRAATHAISNFTTDIYLDDSNDSNGCLYAIPASHKNGTVDVDAMTAEHGFMLPGAAALELGPGDIMFHHVAVVHGSPENHSATLRRTFYIHYMADETMRDAYADWPDLKSTEENMTFWSNAMAERGDSEAAVFRITEAGICPAIDSGA